MYFLNYLFRKLRQVPVLAAATIQEEQLGDYPELADLMAEWSAAGHVTVTVVPLERAHVGEYVRMMSAAGEAADESIVDRLFRLTGGNPFFLREAVSLVTSSPGSPLAGDVVLPRADAILRRRLARADDMTRHFLRAASVVLDTTDELAAITYVMEGDTKDAITALNKACEIRLMREGPHGEVSFVHAPNGGSRAPAASSCVTLSRTGLAGLRARRGRVNSFAAGPVPPAAWGHDGAIRCQPGRHHPGGGTVAR